MGLGLYFELGRSWPELRRRIVFMTGDTLTASVADFLRETTAPVLEKPMQVEALLRAVEQALA